MESNPESEIVHRDLDTNGENPGEQVAEAIAAVEGKEMTDLTQMYDRVDGILDNLFSDPPSLEAQMQVTFTYESYRITIEQDGNVKLVKTK